jgi:hypothetical protein
MFNEFSNNFSVPCSFCQGKRGDPSWVFLIEVKALREQSLHDANVAISNCPGKKAFSIYRLIDVSASYD